MLRVWLFLCPKIPLSGYFKRDQHFYFMSIITQRGDDGETDLMFSKRIKKTSLRIAALGAIDELNAALGLARAADTKNRYSLEIDRIQNLLFGLMGEIACLPENLINYQEKGYACLQEADLDWLVLFAKTEEAKKSPEKHWATPGREGSMFPAYLDYARTIARRAERALLILHEKEPVSPRIRLFMNRLSDTLWIMARID